MERESNYIRIEDIERMGETRGAFETALSFVKDGLISLLQAAEKLGTTEQVLAGYAKEHGINIV
jgi:hypothetical protein